MFSYIYDHEMVKTGSGSGSGSRAYVLPASLSLSLSLSLFVGTVGPITGQKVKPIERILGNLRDALCEIGSLTKLAAAATRFIIARRSSIH